MKPIIIIGKPGSGKTFLSKTLSLLYKKPFFIEGSCLKKTNHFLFHGVSSETDAIIIDELKSFWLINEIISGDNIEVNTKGSSQEYFPIPQIIIILIEPDHPRHLTTTIKCSFKNGHFKFTKNK